MATESVATKHRIPCIDDLLINVMDPTQIRGKINLDRIKMAAANVSYPVGHGIAAIGDLLWMASQAEPTEFHVERSTLGDIGCLLKFLAELQESMDNMHGWAEYREGNPA